MESKAKFGSIKEEAVDLLAESDADSSEQNEFDYNLHYYVHSRIQFFLALSEELFGTLAFSEELLKLTLGDKPLQQVLDGKFFTITSLEKCKSTPLFSKIFLRIQNGDTSEEIATFGESKKASISGTLLWYEDENTWLADNKKQVSSKYMKIIDDLLSFQANVKQTKDQSIATSIDQILKQHSSPIKVAFYGPQGAGKSELINTLCNLNSKQGAVGIKPNWVYIIQQSHTEKFVLNFNLAQNSNATSEVEQNASKDSWTALQGNIALFNNQNKDLFLSFEEYVDQMGKLEEISTIVEQVSIQIPKQYATIPKEFQIIDLPGVDENRSMQNKRAVDALADSDVILWVESIEDFRIKQTEDLTMSLYEAVSPINILVVATHGDKIETKNRSEIMKGTKCFKMFVDIPDGSNILQTQPCLLVGRNMQNSYLSLWSFLKEVARTRTLNLQAQLWELEATMQTPKKEGSMTEGDKLKLSKMIELFGEEAEQNEYKQLQECKDTMHSKLKSLHKNFGPALHEKWNSYYREDHYKLLDSLKNGGYYASPSGDVYFERDIRTALQGVFSTDLAKLEQNLFKSLSSLANEHQKKCTGIDDYLEFDILERRLDQMSLFTQQFKKKFHDIIKATVVKKTEYIVKTWLSKPHKNPMKIISQFTSSITDQIEISPIIKSAYIEVANKANAQSLPTSSAEEFKSLNSSFSEWKMNWLQVKLDTFSTTYLKAICDSP